LSLTGSIITLIGSIFFFSGALGLIRMPDSFNRIQTGTKATTLGSMLFIIGIGISLPEWIGKLILLIVFIFFTNPISSNALARAAHYIKISKKTVQDALEDDKGKDVSNS